MESDRCAAPPLQVRLLGPLTVLVADKPIELPHSRKVRALIAYLALAPRPPTRSQLCALLWDLPNDPRGELRWCLSRIRSVLDGPSRIRVLTNDDTVSLDFSDVFVDVREVQAAIQCGIATLGVDRLRGLCAFFDQSNGGDFLSGLEIERSAPYSAWLSGQRRIFRSAQVAVLEHLVRAISPASDEAFNRIGQWVQLSPFDRQAHATLLDALAMRGQLREGDEHMAATARRFEAEGQDWGAIGHAWHDAKMRHASPSPRLHAVQLAAPAVTAETMAPGSPAAARRASLAVMPFADHSRGATLRGGLADGLVYDIITRLAKLRSMFIIAPGTMFALEQRRMAAEDAGRTLDVDYVVSGGLRRDNDTVTVMVQLTETRTARIVWAEEFADAADEALSLLHQIGNRIVASVANQVELAERNRAILKAPDSLDAWEAHHRGLWHMYRFDRENNEQARRFFETATRLDPGFARPYAGMSFTHFQNAFLGWGDRNIEIEQAYRTASQGLMADDCDPSAHWALGRALWLRGQQHASIAELDTAVELSPNYALGHYTLAFVHSQSGDPEVAIRASDLARELSPYDPLLFGMLASRAMALSRLGRHDEATGWAVRAMARPNAHVHILGIGAYILGLAGRTAESRAVSETIKRIAPGYHLTDLLGAFRFADDAARDISAVAERIGLA